MKLQLFQQILELNQSFDHLIANLTSLELVRFFPTDHIRHARSGFEIARVCANREFFDNFEKIVEDDAKWAYRFQHAFDEKLKGRDDIYLEVRVSEERRKRKELSPRVIILPNWDMFDEDRYAEEHTMRNKKSSSKRHRTRRRSFKESRSRTQDSPSLRIPKKGGHRP